ncbi:hypothetical protein TNCV_2164011 [Trichonephila clavipes]|nr:hypothetical protein TNCV_2164011 [Trichonephila clavipes]
MPSSTVYPKSAALLSVPTIRPLKERLSGPAYLPSLRGIGPRQRRLDFHRKIEEDTLTGDCSEDDEDLMDIQSGPSTSSSRGGASAAHS